MSRPSRSGTTDRGRSSHRRDRTRCRRAPSCATSASSRRLDRADRRRHGRRRPRLRGARPALQRAGPRGLGDQPGDPAHLRQRRRDAPARAGRAAAGGHDGQLAGRPRRAARAGARHEEGVPRARRRLRLDRRRDLRLATAGRPSSTPSPRAATTRSAATSRLSATSRQRCATRPSPAPPCASPATTRSSTPRARPTRARRAARGGPRRRRGAARAHLRVRLLARARPAGDGDLLDPRLVPAAVGPDGDHRRLADRAVPRRADRPRRLDRLRAADRRALARGAREGPRRRRGRRGRDGHAGRPSSSRARPSPSACSR